MSDIEQGAQQPADATGPVLEADMSRRVTETGTGSRAAEAARRLANLDSLPLAEHPDVYEALHGDLHATLTGIDDA